MPEKDLSLKPENQRFLEAWEEIKKLENFSKDSDMLEFLGVHGTAISEIRSGRTVNKKLYIKLRERYGLQDEWVRKGTGYMMVDRPEEEAEGPPKGRDTTLYREGEPPLNDIDLSAGVKNIDYDAVIMLLLLKKKDELKQLIKDVINEKGHE